MNLNDTVEVPDYVKDVCTLWHDGQNSLLYSVSSTGKVQVKNFYSLYCELPNPSDAEDDLDPIAAKAEIRKAKRWVYDLCHDDWWDMMDAAGNEVEA